MNKFDQRSPTWSRKYTPKVIDEMILPINVRKFLVNYQKGIGRQPIVLFGKPGTGKSLTGSILTDDDKIRIACGQRDDLIRIRRMLEGVTSHPLYSDRRTIIIDDCENLSKESLHALREIERLTCVNDFILTTNKIDSLDAPIRSRLTEINFDFVLDSDISEQIRNRLEAICRSENVDPPDRASIDFLIKKFYPDMRKIIGELQKTISLR